MGVTQVAEIIAALAAYSATVTLAAVAFWDIAVRNLKDAQTYREMWQDRVRIMGGGDGVGSDR